MSKSPSIRLLTCLFLLISLHSNSQSAAVEFVSENDQIEPFFVFVNGVKQNESATQNLLLESLPYEVFGVEILFVETNQKIKQVVFLTLGKFSNYIISKHNNLYSLAPGTVVSYDLKRSNSLVSAFKENDNKLMISRKPFLEPELLPKEHLTNFDDLEQEEIRANDTNITTTSRIFKVDSILQANKENVNLAQLKTCEFSQIQGEDVRILKSRVKDIALQQEKFQLLSNSISKKCIRIAELKELMRLLDQDELKVNLFNIISDNVLNIENKNQLYDLFLFETSIKDLK